MPSTAPRTMTTDDFATIETLVGAESESAGHRRRCHRRLPVPGGPEKTSGARSPVGHRRKGVATFPRAQAKISQPAVRDPSCERPGILRTVALDGVAIKIGVALTKGEVSG